jgi:hypothetical protein
VPELPDVRPDDGEVVGSTRRLTVVVKPGALLLRVPSE